MKQVKLTFVLIILMNMVCHRANADFNTSTKVTVGSFYYYLDTSNNLAEVTSIPSDVGVYYGDIEIPASITYGGTTFTVIKVGDEAFFKCWDLQSVIIPNSVTSIGGSAFSGCI